jgi:hypothetical protein
MHRGKNKTLSQEGQGNAYRTKEDVKMNYLFSVPATIYPTEQIICLKRPVIRLFLVTNF